MSDYIRPVLAVVLPNVGGFIGARLSYGSIKSKPDGPPSWYEVSESRSEAYFVVCSMLVV